MRKIQVFDIPVIIQMYNDGISSKKIAEHFNVDASLILIYLKENGVPTRSNNKLTQVEVDRIIEMYNDGMSIKSISKDFDVSDVTIGNYLKRNNVKIRSTHLTELDTDLLIDMYNSGMSMRSIAKWFGTNHGAISRRIRGKVELRDNIYYYINGDVNAPHVAKPRTCVNCGKEFILRDETGRSIPRYKTCSDTCLHEFLSLSQINEKSVSWKGGASQGYYQKQARKNKDMVCNMCGEKNVRLDVHHIDKDKSNNDPSNIMILCVSCHAKWHYENGDSGLRGAP